MKPRVGSVKEKNKIDRPLARLRERKKKKSRGENIQTKLEMTKMTLQLTL